MRTEPAGCSASTPGQTSVPLVSVRRRAGGPWWQARGRCWCAKPPWWHARGGKPWPGERRVPPRGGCGGGGDPCFLSLFMKNPSFLTKAWRAARPGGAFSGGRGHCCGAHGCVPAGMRLCPGPRAAAAAETPIPPCRGPAGLGGGDPPGLVPPEFCRGKLYSTPEAWSSRRARGLFGAGVGQGTLGTSLAAQGGRMLLF